MFKCTYCEESFGNAGALAQHEEYCRENPENFKPCKVCGNALPKDDRIYCSVSCANKDRKHSEKTKEKIKNSVAKVYNNLHSKEYDSSVGEELKECNSCNEEFRVSLRSEKKLCDSCKISECKWCETDTLNEKFCSVSCSMKYHNFHNNLARRGGKEAAKVNNEERRSKNEKYFAKLCKEEFDKVLTNEPIFNGWDADVILPDEKIAVLWNGIWHYEKITENHSVEQVQNRDRIKKKEIRNKGYTPIVIEDRGKHNKEFVEQSFKNFLESKFR